MSRESAENPGSQRPGHERPGFQRLDYARPTVAEQRGRVADLLGDLARRRSVRHFSADPIPLDVLDDCIRVAALAPSGANKQPWTFCVVTDPAVKRRVRLAAEAEERAFYGGRASERWLADLADLGTDASKPFLETAPALIVIFAQKRGVAGDKHYYISESVGIAAGFLISALHRCGFVTLTHTPSPMGFLAELLDRPTNERAFLLLPVGYPAADCQVPAIERKPFDQVRVRYDADPISNSSASPAREE